MRSIKVEGGRPFPLKEVLSTCVRQFMNKQQVCSTNAGTHKVYNNFPSLSVSLEEALRVDAKVLPYWCSRPVVHEATTTLLGVLRKTSLRTLGQLQLRFCHLQPKRVHFSNGS